MIVLGYIVSLLIGIVLGLVGGGGAILSIPLLTYFFSQSTDQATTISLIIVTFSSVFGVFQRIGGKFISYREALYFVFPSMALAFVLRKYRKYIIPDQFSVFDIKITRDFVLDCLLVVVMIIVSIRMFRSLNNKEPKKHLFTLKKVLLMGAITGSLSGFLGAGGGFIIVPILLGMGMEPKKAIGTSLFIVTIQSFVALLGDFLGASTHFIEQFDWQLIATVSILSIFGTLIGSKLQSRFSGDKLRFGFASLLLILAIFIFIDRILLFK